MKLDVGMYVRTKEGYICRVLKLKEEINDDGYLDFNDIGSPSIQKKNVINASHNIIDLLEAGDYVNGNKVMEADWINENGEYEEGLAFPMYASDDLDVIENWLPLRCVDIKSVLTHEQIESMSYKIGE